MDQKKNNSLLSKLNLTSTELRIIGISLAILSLGLAIAYAGFVWFSTQEKGSYPSITPTPTEEGRKK